MFAASARAVVLQSQGQEQAIGLGNLISQPQAQAATPLWDNIPQAGDGITTTTSSPRTSGADDMFWDGTTHATLVTGMRLGYTVASGGPSAFDVRVRMWDDIDYSASTGTPQFQNLKGDFRVSFTGQSAGAFLSGLINLTGLPGGGVLVTDNPANDGDEVMDVFMQMDFLQPGTNTSVASNGVSFIFRGGASDPNAGYTFDSPILGGPGNGTGDFYWRDANGNQVITGDEARSFAAPTRANWVTYLEGMDVVAPEPATAGLLGAGLLGLALRRRSK